MKKTIATLIVLASTISAFAEINKDQALEAANNAGIECNQQDDSTSVSILNVQSREYALVSCIAGAYNAQSVLLKEEKRYDSVSDNAGRNVLVPVSFSDVITNNRDRIVGITSSLVVGDLSYNEKKQLFITFSKGRGLGDISSSAEYKIVNDQMVLVRSILDKTMDGKINPKVVFSSK